MITKEGYSKDMMLTPEGIVITFGQNMIQEQGGLLRFLKKFEVIMDNCEKGCYWMHYCSNLPSREVDYIYISVAGRLYGRVYNGGYKKYDPENPIMGYTADGREVEIKKNHIVLSGPIEKCPFKRRLPGFQGIRYCTKLF